MPDAELFTDARDTVAKRLRGMLLQGVAQSRLQNARNRVHRTTSRERHHHRQRPDRPGFGFDRCSEDCKQGSQDKPKHSWLPWCKLAALCGFS